MTEKYNFLSIDALEMILSQLGWNYSNSLNDIIGEHQSYSLKRIPFRADFYPPGWRLAASKKAIIISDGETEIEYKGELFYSPWEIFDRFGEDSLLDINNWNFIVERQWLIRKLNGDWVKSFTLLTECPFRTVIRC